MKNPIQIVIQQKCAEFATELAGILQEEMLEGMATLLNGGKRPRGTRKKRATRQLSSGPKRKPRKKKTATRKRRSPKLNPSNLSGQKAKVYGFLKKSANKPPSVAQVQKKLGVSLQGTYSILSQMSKAGLIKSQSVEGSRSKVYVTK